MEKLSPYLLALAILLLGILIGDYADFGIDDYLSGRNRTYVDCGSSVGVESEEAHRLSVNYRVLTDLCSDLTTEQYKQDTYFEMTNEQIENLYCTSRYISSNAGPDFGDSYRFYFGKETPDSTRADYKMVVVGLNKDKTEMLKLVNDNMGIKKIVSMLPCPQQCDVDIINNSEIFRGREGQNSCGD